MHKLSWATLMEYYLVKTLASNNPQTLINFFKENLKAYFFTLGNGTFAF